MAMPDHRAQTEIATAVGGTFSHSRVSSRLSRRQSSGWPRSLPTAATQEVVIAYTASSPAAGATGATGPTRATGMTGATGEHGESGAQGVT
jgi:hypothetical protein